VVNSLKDVNCQMGNECCCAGITVLMMSIDADTTKQLLAAGADDYSQR
jgi:hypothetical protein